MIEEWETEPDSLEWEHKGVKLKIKRHPELKHLCGYAAMDRNHPWFLRHYDANCFNKIEVHGGLTYSKKGEDGLWWIGFDCAHLGDISPGMPSFVMREGVYRNLKYVKHHTETLAEAIYNRLTFTGKTEATMACVTHILAKITKT